MADSHITLYQLLNTRRCLLRVLKQEIKQEVKQKALGYQPMASNSASIANQLDNFRPIIAQQQKRILMDAFVDNIYALCPDIQTVKHHILISEPKKQTLFLDLSFTSQSIQVQLDAAIADENNQWHLFLLKSGTGVKQNDLLQAAFTLILFEQLGYSVNQFSICIVKRKCVNEAKNCIELIPVLDELREHQDSINEELVELQEQFFISANQQLDTIKPNLKKACFKPNRCQYFGDCWPTISEHTIFTISHLHPDRKQELVSNGIIDIDDITELDNFTPRQQRYIELVKNRSSDIDWHSIKERLSNLIWPIYFLDFEADNPSIPSYPNTPTFAKIVFQFSCHRVNSINDLINGNIEHMQYLHCDESDPRPNVAEALQKAINTNGSIIVWHADFERSRLLEMADLLPETSQFLTDLSSRLWDLELIFIHDFHDYRANGSNSLKSIYPMIQNRANDVINRLLTAENSELEHSILALKRIRDGIDYAGLQINDGEQVIAAWYLLKSLEGVAKAELLQQMQRYCQLDTFALTDILLYLVIAEKDTRFYDASSSADTD